MDELISRQALIKDAKSWVAVDEHERKLQRNVIEWLKNFPSATDNNVGIKLGTNLAEVGTDCISRQAAIDALGYAQHRFTVADEAGGMRTVKWSENVIYFAAAERVLTDLPSAQPKKGKWIKSGKWGRVYKCNQCGNFLDFDGVNVGRGSANFCPNCGADMRQKGENSESN